MRLVWDDPKLPDDVGKVRKLNGVVGGLIYGCKIFSILVKTSEVVKLGVSKKMKIK